MIPRKHLAVYQFSERAQLSTYLVGSSANAPCPSYADGGIIREGIAGDQGDGAFSTGVCIHTYHLPPPLYPQLPTSYPRFSLPYPPKQFPPSPDTHTGSILTSSPPFQRGGAANIGSPGLKPTRGAPHDSDVVPETAIRRESQQNYHVGVSLYCTLSP